MLFELRIRILGYSNASNLFFGCIKQSKIRKCSESNSERPILTSKSAQNNPWTLALKNYAQKWSQIEKWLDG